MTDDHHTHAADEVHEHDLGLQHDLGTLERRGFTRGMGRRGVLGVLGGIGVAAVAGCASGDSGSSGASTATTPSGGPPSGGPGGAPGGGMGGDSSVEVADGEIPEETAGPYPAVLPGAAVYAWHCDRGGAYSMYDGDAAAENYLRGVQESDADGWVEFTTIFPGCYAGRWPHVHFEVYESLDAATSATNKLRTSQLAFPQDACEQVYATSGYEASVANLAGVSLDSDGIFSDGYSLQMATMKGSVAGGLTATLNVPI